MKHKFTYLMNAALNASIFLFFSSCVNINKATYFNGQEDAVLTDAQAAFESVIQKHDLLDISVSSLNPAASALFNTPNQYNNTSMYANANVQHSSGYLVRSDGNIQLPILGNIKAEGFTIQTLRDTIASYLLERRLLVDPIVNVRYLNFRVTVLGEVSKPSVINIPDEKITLLEALGLAGDITIFGKRDNVMLIREEDNSKIIKRIDLNSTDFLTSPYYYLKSNDIIYVQPNKTKIASSSRTMQLLPIILSSLSFTAIILNRIIP
jgi:polysaccharide export outer membrane protein